MRPALLIVLVTLAACGGGDDADPHVIVTCSGWVDNQGNPITGQCEAACRVPPASTGEACDTVTQLNCAAFEFSGIDGCCIEQADVIKFVECQ